MITICGRPNVGKSSLTNALVGEKIAIVSNKPQTTRNRICGIVNRGDTQFVLMDTPGCTSPSQPLGDYMVNVVKEPGGRGRRDAAGGAHPPCGRAGGGAGRPHPGGEAPCHAVHQQDRHRGKPDELLPVIAAYSTRKWDGFDAIIPISAHTGRRAGRADGRAGKIRRPGPQLFPDGMTTDQPERQVMAEIMREKLLLCLDKEIPTAPRWRSPAFPSGTGMVDVDATIYCEKESHKGIIIGKQGAMLKKISTLARQDMEKFMGTKVFCRPG
jgi:GTP-binding protein Era